MVRPAPSPRAGRAPLLVALAVAVAGVLGGLYWLLGSTGVSEAGPSSPEAEPGGASPSLLRALGDEDPDVSHDAGAARREGVASVEPGGDERRSWSGTVRDAWSGAPLAEAQVHLVAAGAKQSATTGEDGRFTLTWPADLEAGLALQHPAYVDVRAPSIDLSREGDFALEPSATLRGYVEPPPDGDGAIVMAWLEAASSQRFWDALETPVGPDGAFALTDLDPGDYVLTALSPGRTIAPQAGLHLERGETLEVMLRAEPSASVEGVVLRMPQGRGVPAVRVRAGPRDDNLPRDWSRSVTVETVSNERGRYALAGLGPGRWRIEAEAPWGVQIRRDLDISGSGERIELDLELPGPARLAGRVADATGRGVEGARVLVVTGNRLRGLTELAAGAEFADAPSTHSGPSGAFALDQAPAHTNLALVAIASAPDGDGTPRLGFARIGVLESDEVRGGLEVLLAEPLSVRGIVVGAEGEAIAGATIEAAGRPGGVRADLSRAVSAEDGRFEIAGLPAGPAFLSVQHPDWLDAGLAVDPAVETGEVEIRLQPAYVLEGIALDTQGFGVANVPVGLAASDEAGQRDRGRSQRNRRGARTDPYGRFHIDGLPAGTWIVGASSYEWQQIEARPDLVHTPGDSFVSLTLEPRERPLRAEIRGELALAGGGTPSGVRIEGLRGGVLSVDRGDFRATGLVPTQQRLTLRADGHATVRTEAIDLRPGQVHDLGRIVLEPATALLVNVRDEQGAPVDGARVRLLPLPRAEGGAGEGSAALNLRNRGRGRYLTGDATRHAWRLVVDREGFRRSARRLEVVASERQDVTVELERRPSDG